MFQSSLLSEDPFVMMMCLKQEQPNLATISTGTVVHSIKMSKTCFRASEEAFRQLSSF